MDGSRRGTGTVTSAGPFSRPHILFGSGAPLKLRPPRVAHQEAGKRSRTTGIALTSARRMVDNDGLSHRLSAVAVSMTDDRRPLRPDRRAEPRSIQGGHPLTRN